MKDRMERKSPSASVEDTGWHNKAAIGALIVLLGAVYLSTLLPGVSEGDSTELQYASAFLAVCHSPGYQIEVTFGKLFSLLPIGPSIAWRINFMMAVFGTIGCLALYGAVRRMCGFIIPAIVAATTLAFSSIYWTHCLQAEAYVFYGTFLLLGIYTIVRFVQSGKGVVKIGWLYLTALFLGVCVADRSSELFVLPAFLLLWLLIRKKIHWGSKPRKKALIHILLSMIAFILPFICTTILFLMRENTAHFHTRDNVLKYKIISGDLDYRQPSFFKRIKPGIYYCLGLSYIKEAGFRTDRLTQDVNKYAWLLSGWGAFGDRYPKENRRQNIDQCHGTSIGSLGLLLMLAAIILQRKQYPWILFGLGLFLGNLVFILWHSRWDNLTFTIPGQIGLCLLVGLGATGLQSSQKLPRRIIFQITSFLVPVFLLVSNYSLLDMSTREQEKLLERYHKLAEAPLPANSVLINTYWPTMTYRYLFYVEAKRTDVYVMTLESRQREQRSKLIDYFTKIGQPVFVDKYSINPQTRQTLLEHTPSEIAGLGLLLVNPGFKEDN